MNKVRWSQDELQFLKDNVNIYNDAQMARELSINFNRIFTRDATRKARQRLGIKKQAHRSFFKIIDKEV